VLPMSAAATGSAAAAHSATRNLRKQRLDDARRRTFAASRRVLSAPELGEVGEAARERLVAKRRKRGAREGELGRRGIHRTELAHAPVHDAARGAPGEEVRERRVARFGRLQRGPINGARGRLVAEKERG